MQGICLPLCTFADDGSAAQGCSGSDKCVPYTWTMSSTGTVTGIGFCQGGCQSDADCSTLGATWKCQTDIGFCTTTPVVRGGDAGSDAGGTLGSACTAAEGTMGLCNCESNNVTGNGFCTHACVIGGTACPDGWTCDNLVSSQLVFNNDAGTVALTKENIDTVGGCFPSCTRVDASTGCPVNSTCSKETVVGPDCIP